MLSPNPETDKNIHYGKYPVHVGGNRGRGQVYPTGDKSNNTLFNASAAGTISQIAKVEARQLHELSAAPLHLVDGSSTVGASKL